MSLFSGLFGPPTQTKFAAVFINELRRYGEIRPVQVDADKFHLTLAGGEVISLTNLYAEHCLLPRAGRRTHLRKLAQAITSKKDLPGDFADARANLRPKIYLRSTIEMLRLQGRLTGKPTPNFPVYPLGSHLLLSLVYDMPDTMRSISESDLENWGVSYYEAMEAAVENLEKTSVAYAKVGDSFCSACSGDNYDSARVLLIDQIRGFGLAGDPIAMVPQRDALYVTGSEDDVGLKIMAGLTAETVAKQPRPLSPIPLRLVDGEWQDWLPDPAHPHYSAFDELRQQFQGNLYHEQKEVLEALFEKEHRDVFVASFSGMQNRKTSRVTTYCVWIEGLPSLLPEAQSITFMKDDQTVVASGSFSRVREIVGDLLVEEPDLYPPRFAISEFPSDEQLARIGHHLPDQQDL